MLVYFDEDENRKVSAMGRYHPWTVTVAPRKGGHYKDFKASTEEISTVLEDLAYVAGGPAEEAIVAFITWANGPESIFETNDFGLKPITINDSGISAKAKEQLCRLTILFRDLKRNTAVANLLHFAYGVEAALRSNDRLFDQACWGWCLWPHLFCALGNASNPDAEGNVLQYQLWAWGDDECEVQDHIARSFANLRAALTQASA